MKVLVTGCAGFIGFRLTQKLLQAGHSVVGIDNYLSLLYPSQARQHNIQRIASNPNFAFYEMDLTTSDLQTCLKEVEVVVHLAALPGLVMSWSHFNEYMNNNILATQRLLDASISASNPHFIFASSSSVYGSHAIGDESKPLEPISPYGVTKVASEQLIRAYCNANPKMSYSILRYFSVFGPGQRPDMAYAKMCEAINQEQQVLITGDGKQTRSNTFVDDIVSATWLTIHQKPKNITMNICGDEEITILDVVDTIGHALNKTPKIRFVDPRPGDQISTRGDSSLAHQTIGWTPTIDIRSGLIKQAIDASQAN